MNPMCGETISQSFQDCLPSAFVERNKKSFEDGLSSKEIERQPPALSESDLSLKLLVTYP
jgi:hypothetical protein